MYIETFRLHFCFSYHEAQLYTLTEYATFFQNSLRELTVSPNKSVSRCNYVDADHIKSTNTWGRVSQILKTNY